MDYELLLINLTRDKKVAGTYFNDCIGQHIIAEYLRQFDFAAKVYSSDVRNIKELLKNEIEKHGVLIVGFYIAADNIQTVINVIKWLKKKYPKEIVVLGGPQTVALDIDFFITNRIDYAVIGEGEIPTLGLLRYLIDQEGDLTDIPSISYVDKEGKLHQNQTEQAIIQNLDSLPFPQIRNSLNSSFRKRNTVGIITGRGCPFHCAFCYEGTCSKIVRFRSVNSVMKEIDAIIENNPNLKYLNIYDDTFTLNRERILDFCEKIRQRKIKWYCEGHVSFLYANPDLIVVMKEAGLAGIQLGIESGSKKVLKAYRKKISPDETLRVIEEIKKAGISNVCGNLIIGGACESWETLEDTTAFAKKMIQRGRGILELSTVYFAAYPETDMQRYPEKYGIKLKKDQEYFSISSMRSIVVETEALSPKDIWNAKRKIDEEIQNEYYKQALQITKTELMQGLFVDQEFVDHNRTWLKMYEQIPHIASFLKHMDTEEMLFDSEKYPIRTFEDFYLENNSLCMEKGIYVGKKALFLLYANGKNTTKEIKNILQLTDHEIYDLYMELHEECLVYMSVF